MGMADDCTSIRIEQMRLRQHVVIKEQDPVCRGVVEPYIASMACTPIGTVRHDLHKVAAAVAFKRKAVPMCILCIRHVLHPSDQLLVRVVNDNPELDSGRP